MSSNTGGKQTPWISSSPMPRVYLAGQGREPQPPMIPSKPTRGTARLGTCALLTATSVSVLPGHQLVTVEKELVKRDNYTYWAVCITYLDGSSPTIAPQKKRSSIDYREVLNEADFSVYAELRDVRKLLAEREGVPVYAIFSNAQLAEMVTKKVVSLAAMKQINGIGKAKLDRYAGAFLDVLNKTFG